MTALEYGADVHHGFERDTIRAWLAAAGLVGVSIGGCGAIENGGRSYSVFIAACRKP